MPVITGDPKGDTFMIDEKGKNGAMASQTLHTRSVLYASVL